MTTEEKTIDKIRKLLALATSPNEHEASLAMQKAGELMARSGLCIADIKGIDDTPAVRDEYMPHKSKTKIAWKATLMHQIANLFECRAINYTIRGVWESRLLGMPSDVDMCKGLFLDLAHQIDLMATKFVPMQHRRVRTEKNAYRFGLVCGVIQRLKDAQTSRDTTLRREASDTMALVVVKKEIVDKYVADNIRTSRGRKTRITGSQFAYSAGVSDSKNLNIHKSISA